MTSRLVTTVRLAVLVAAALPAFAQIPSLKQLEALVGSQQASEKLVKSDPIAYGWDLLLDRKSVV